MSKKQVTLADLAKELGISTATVSRALKNYPDISDETKKRVLALAKRLSYRPNSLAASLRKQETHIIGVIIPEIINHFFSAVIKGIMAVAYEANYRVMLCQSDESIEKEIADAQALLDSRVDGLLISLANGNHDGLHLLDFIRAGTPVVMFDKVSDNIPNVSKVVVDDYQGAFKAVSHLIEQGCKRIAVFRSPPASTSHNRFKGYIDAHKKFELPVDKGLIIDCHNSTHEEGYHFAHYMMAQRFPPDGLFSMADSMAISAMIAIKELGYQIPLDIAICGFSDSHISSIIDPPLSSVSQPAFEMGQKAMHLLLHEIQAAKNETTLSPKTIVLNTELHIRASTLSPKSNSN